MENGAPPAPATAQHGYRCVRRFLCCEVVKNVISWVCGIILVRVSLFCYLSRFSNFDCFFFFCFLDLLDLEQIVEVEKEEEEDICLENSRESDLEMKLEMKNRRN